VVKIREEYAKKVPGMITTARNPLTSAEVDMLRAVRSGADIHSDQDAAICRALAMLGLAHITDPAEPARRVALLHGALSDGPWFGCIATGYGRRVLAAHRGRRALP
jgi:hypothetical protein